ncbi:MAG: hypothetical protein ACPGVU_19900 [Limisphaerales bacterium]
MKNTTYLALLAAVSMTAPTHGAERPESNGTTSDEAVSRPDRPTSTENSALNRPEVQQAISVIRSTQAELDRIKEALRRIRFDNPNLTSEQLATIKERLTQRARDLIINARSVSDRIQDLRPRLSARDELLAKAQELRKTRQDPEKAKSGRDRE